MIALPSPRLPVHRLAIPCIGLGFVLALAASGVSAQEMLRCLPNPPADPPDGCQTFAFEIEVVTSTTTGEPVWDLLPGDQLTGTFTAYVDTPDVDGLPNRGRYLNSIECVNLDLGDRLMAVEHEPVEISLPPAESDPGVTVINDDEQPGTGVTIFSDTVTYAMAGPMLIEDIATPDPLDFRSGGGGFAFGWGDTCFTPFGPPPCPSLALEDDGFPPAPGDTTGFESASMTIQAVTLANDSGIVQATIRSIDDAPRVLCPEPGLGVGLAATGLVIAAAARRRR